MADQLNSGSRPRARRGKKQAEKCLGQFTEHLGAIEQASDTLASSSSMMAAAFDEMAAATRRTTDRLFSHWIDRAHRFGAVAAHFPKSLRKRRFVASFWAPEVLLFGNYYLLAPGFTRGTADRFCAKLIARSGPTGYVALRRWLPVIQPDLPHAGVWQEVDTGKPRFWSPELPEVASVSCYRSATIKSFPVETVTRFASNVAPSILWTQARLSHHGR